MCSRRGHIVEGNAIAHQVNAEIRKLAGRFEALGGAHDDVIWLCVCGCFERITLTIAAYDAAGGNAYAADHPSAP
jgi:hypothetical protein